LWYAYIVGWTLAKHDVRTFERNTLAAVIVQLRFHPILRIAEDLAAFQEKMRPRFPGYEAVEAQTVDVGPHGIQVRNETAHRFRAEAEPSVLSLGTSSFSIEYAAHKDRDTLFADVDAAVGALNELYSPVQPLRLGLRYVNVVEPQRLATDLSRSVGWDELLTPSFAAVPGGVATLDESTNFAVEVSVPAARGKMTLMYAFLPSVANSAQHLRLDTDRFIEAGFEMKEVRGLLESFSGDIFQVFMTAAGPALLEWMATKGES